MSQEYENSCNTVFPRDIVCVRNISINTLHKGEEEDDDDDDDNNNNNKVLGFFDINPYRTNVENRVSS